MKKYGSIVALIAALALVPALLTGCGLKSEKGSEGSKGDKVLKIGASPTPHAQILEQVKDVLAEEGIELEIVEYTDYILPNSGVDSGELDANYFQHKPYLDDFNEENGTDIVSVASIHFEPLGIYAGKVDSIDKLGKGAKIAVPNDATNEARALLLLQDQGLIKLKDGVGLEATVKDIIDNPKNIEFVEIEAAATASTLKDVDLAVINGNYALSAGLTADDALTTEAADSLAAETYANIIAVKAGHEDDAAVKALVKALQSDEVKSYIEKTYGKSVVAVF